MTSRQFLDKAKPGNPLPPAIVFIGPDLYSRDRCRSRLIEAALPPEDREQGITRFDLSQCEMAEILDDARSMSLFATTRLILVSNAEAALPKRMTDDEDGPSGGAELLAAYISDPSPDVTIAFECTRFTYEGDDKRKLDRVQKFFASVPAIVELRHPDSEEARREALALASAAGIKLDRGAVDTLVESLGADLARISVEIEKLALFIGNQRPVTENDIGQLVPEARANTIFELVSALGRRDRTRSLQILDTLTRAGEYLPLALAFLSTQFRTALIAQEKGLRGSSQIQGYFQRLGVPMWGSRAEQVQMTATRFDRTQLERALHLISEADRGLRDTNPDDRIVMERFIFALTQ
jgi:DNA polymerase-3 subunit delta